ncbi:MAG TPA: hypothetical protein VIU61_16710 [Kofleriaceae bacterium]
MMIRSILLLCLLAGCPTSFTGDAHFPGGPQACRATCERGGLEMSGFVFSGEFSTSCVCRPPRAPASPFQPPQPGPPQSTPPQPVSELEDGADVEIGAAVGTALQARRAQQQQQSTR